MVDRWRDFWLNTSDSASSGFPLSEGWNVKYIIMKDDLQKSLKCNPASSISFITFIMLLIFIFTVLGDLSELSEELLQKKEGLFLPAMSLFPLPLTQRPLDNAERLMSLGDSE